MDVSHQLIACAAGGEVGFMEDAQYPISVFFYPITGASDFRYFESADENIDIWDYSKFHERKLADEPVFNGYLRRFKHPSISKRIWGIVTYKVGNTLHICRAMNIKYADLPTEFTPQLLTTAENGINPQFDWQDGTIHDNAIYFEVVSDTLDNLVSGTYTYDRHFTFYDTSNVVLNIHSVNPPPVLDSNSRYIFTMMGVSYDNWVNQIIQKSFLTH
jgi:hypothetical protein